MYSIEQFLIILSLSYPGVTTSTTSTHTVPRGIVTATQVPKGTCTFPSTLASALQQPQPSSQPPPQPSSQPPPQPSPQPPPQPSSQEQLVSPAASSSAPSVSAASSTTSAGSAGEASALFSQLTSAPAASSSDSGTAAAKSEAGAASLTLAQGAAAPRLTSGVESLLDAELPTGSSSKPSAADLSSSSLASASPSLPFSSSQLSSSLLSQAASQLMEANSLLVGSSSGHSDGVTSTGSSYEDVTAPEVTPDLLAQVSSFLNMPAVVAEGSQPAEPSGQSPSTGGLEIPSIHLCTCNYS